MTLVEVVVTLAISSMLGALLLAGQRGVREEAQFANAIEIVRNNIVAVKNAANVTRNDSFDNQAGSRVNDIVFGKIITFQPGANTLLVESIIASDSNDTSAMRLEDPYSISIPGSVRFSGSGTRYVAFIRAKDNGRLLVYTPAAGDRTNQNYYNHANRSSTVSLPFTGTITRTGSIEIDARSGEIRRVIQ